MSTSSTFHKYCIVFLLSSIIQILFGFFYTDVYILNTLLHCISLTNPTPQIWFIYNGIIGLYEQGICIIENKNALFLNKCINSCIMFVVADMILRNNEINNIHKFVFEYQLMANIAIIQVYLQILQYLFYFI